MESAFAKIEDPATHDRKEEIKKNAEESDESAKKDTKQSVKTTSFPNVAKYFVIALVLIAIVTLIIFFVIKPSKDELSNTRKELEMMRRNETALKTKVNTYEEQMRRLKATEAMAQRQQLVSNDQMYDHSFHEQNQLPTENDFDDVQEYEPNVKRKPDPRVEDKKRIKEMVNKKRETVADMQEATAARREQIRKEQEERIQAELEEKTHSNMYKDDKTKEAIFGAVSSGGVLVDDE